MDRGAWWAAVHGVARSRTWLSDFTFTFHFHALEKEMATNSSVLAWRIPGTEEPGRLLSVGLHRVRHDWSDLAVAVTVILRYKLCVWVFESLNLFLPREKSKNLRSEKDSPLSCSWPYTDRCLKTAVKYQGFPSGPVVKNPPAKAGDMVSIPAAGRSHRRQSN